MSPSSFPPQAPSSGRPLPSAGSSGASSPTSSVPISRLRLLASPRASLRFLRSALPPLRPLRSPGAGRFPGGLDHFYRGARAASPRWRRRDIPGSWATLAYMPRSSTPADRRTQATTGPAMWSSVRLTTSTPRLRLSRLNHAACTLSVYASQPGSPPDHATLDSGWWPALTGQDSHLLGRVEGFRHVYPSTWLPPSPSFAWRNNRSVGPCSPGRSVIVNGRNAQSSFVLPHRTKRRTSLLHGPTERLLTVIVRSGRGDRER